MNVIKQVIPADGWWARFSSNTGGAYYSKLAAWALVRDSDFPDSEGDLVGIDMDENGVAMLCDDISNFTNYEYSPDSHPSG